MELSVLNKIYIKYKTGYEKQFPIKADCMQIMGLTKPSKPSSLSQEAYKWKAFKETGKYVSLS